eukprot:2309761-Amphidinium_carterae.1
MLGFHPNVWRLGSQTRLSDEDLIECGVEFFNQTLEERKTSAARTRRAMRLLVEATTAFHFSV